MREEFHGDGDGVGYKKLYGWNTLNTNVWLPSLSELVGYDVATYSSVFGTYYSAMQGLNTSGSYYYVDAQGGAQFAYFRPYNTSGGGAKIWVVCNQQQAWTRSSILDYSTHAWRTTNAQRLDTSFTTNSAAVHPAVEGESLCVLLVSDGHCRTKGGI